VFIFPRQSSLSNCGLYASVSGTALPKTQLTPDTNQLLQQMQKYHKLINFWSVIHTAQLPDLRLIGMIDDQ